jgi:hypothetical protein
MAALTTIQNRLTALEAELLACQIETVPTTPQTCVATLDGPQTSASIEFTPPASDGGLVISGYVAISTPGGFTASGAAPPLVVAGLHGASSEYTFEVRAINAVGHSLPCVTETVGTSPCESELATLRARVTNGAMLVGTNPNPGQNVKQSYDGVNWYEMGISTSFNQLSTSGDDRWVLLATGNVTGGRYSAEGRVWQSFTTAITGNRVAYSAVLDRWVVVGATFYYSSDGLTWETGMGATAGTFNDVAYNGFDMWVACGDNGLIARSSDGITWVQDAAKVGWTATNAVLGGVAFSTVDARWFVNGREATGVYSSDGITWTGTTTPFAAPSTGAALHVAHNGIDRFVAMGTNQIAYSLDGIAWTESTVFGVPAGLKSVAYNPPTGKFYVVGNSGVNSFGYVSNDDGVSWGNSLGTTLEMPLCIASSLLLPH